MAVTLEVWRLAWRLVRVDGDGSRRAGRAGCDTIRVRARHSPRAVAPIDTSDPY